ncbi:hypothetical protein [Aliiruegeria lutimaris]|uniref:Uncharacterized protein n=1 Tax=Aliiruegeria lutimaris TaxID=571298 RepID=A0A1G8ZTG2_9RHOB|nr:hypothetical protein [Aliiruegeria lutimaris]SDK18406.1 hypothetical protein SAMN04488026_103340 [Aliiruegeria lutimaris]
MSEAKRKAGWLGLGCGTACIWLGYVNVPVPRTSANTNRVEEASPWKS